MDFMKRAYQETFVISGTEFSGGRDIAKGTIRIPYTETPNVEIGDVVVQKMAGKDVNFKVIDLSFREQGTLGIGTSHPHMLTLHVKNATSESVLPSAGSSVFNIGTVSGGNVQVGNNNSLGIHITFQQLVKEIAETDDPDAKSKLRDFLNNRTVASLIGAGVSQLISIL